MLGQARGSFGGAGDSWGVSSTRMESVRSNDDAI